MKTGHVAEQVTPGFFVGGPRDQKRRDGDFVGQVWFFYKGNKPKVVALVRGKTLQQMRRMKSLMAFAMNQHKEAMMEGAV